ncbi:MAG: PDZ domain-containing protein [Phycisphaerales bacterium]|nr:PDZ domain-containing protein [Phycisphaerales bacterium]
MTRMLVAGIAIPAILIAGSASADDTDTTTVESTSTVTIKIDGDETEIWVDGEKVEAPELKAKLLQKHMHGAAGSRVMIGEPGEHMTLALKLAGEADYEPPRVMVGVIMDDEIDPALASQLRLDPKAAFIINIVHEGSPADKAGLQVYDIVTAVQGASPASTGLLSKTLKGMDPGDALTLKLIRSGEPTVAVVMLEAWDPDVMGQAELSKMIQREMTLGSAGEAQREFLIKRIEGMMDMPQAVWIEKLEALDDLDIDLDIEGIEEAIKHLQHAHGDMDIRIMTPQHLPHPGKIDLEERTEKLAARLDDLEKKLDKKLSRIEKLLRKLVEDE